MTSPTMFSPCCSVKKTRLSSGSIDLPSRPCTDGSPSETWTPVGSLSSPAFSASKSRPRATKRTASALACARHRPKPNPACLTVHAECRPGLPQQAECLYPQKRGYQTRRETDRLEQRSRFCQFRNRCRDRPRDRRRNQRGKWIPTPPVPQERADCQTCYQYLP